ncbi:GtrA family protein [Magnetofaba australis]|uniref:Putative GtrA-like protein n=1 Tax=Magnetofaba australis IT-1 TaxID=1434232 RepID=A0A1Y2K2L8_9PROT|nr:GtrA family protein [Magnetofaba australis]OSM02253.1 putative GtrA-like protein [Magnetofaba australis IT-1]
MQDWRSQLERHARKIRYLIGGAYNTLFGMGCYAALILAFGEDHYLPLAVVNHLLAVTNAYVVHRIFVFKSTGHWVSEYWRFHVVYAAAFANSLWMLWVLVNFAELHPIAAQGIVIAITVAASYLGHKHFSFRVGKEEQPKQGDPAS